jgi:hypothetical protein
MKRRAFLLGLIAAPAAPILPKLAAEPPKFWGGAIGGGMADLLSSALDKIINPPLVIDANGNITELFAVNYHEEVIATFEQNRALLRAIVTQKSPIS